MFEQEILIFSIRNPLRNYVAESRTTDEKMNGTQLQMSIAKKMLHQKKRHRWAIIRQQTLRRGEDFARTSSSLNPYKPNPARTLGNRLQRIPSPYLHLENINPAFWPTLVNLPPLDELLASLNA